MHRYKQFSLKKTDTVQSPLRGCTVSLFKNVLTELSCPLSAVFFLFGAGGLSLDGEMGVQRQQRAQQQLSIVT